MKNLLLPAIFCSLIPCLVYAGDNHDLMPARHIHTSVPSSAPSLYVSMDQSQIVELSDNAASIVIGNPVHANVLMDTPKRLIIVPRAAGATHFTVLNQAGDVILQRHVIVAAPKQNYVRVRTATCGENNEGCAQTQTYYCETDGMCHTILSPVVEGGGSGDSMEMEDQSAQINNSTSEDVTYSE